ncbi:DUF7411 family protein [Methanothermobacter thermautotrophicus]|uniref:Conserved protein n=1 Tax=Methanothermobacter thermautotrophicus (strain ATCC 29096 / DSM 1053 / JCM 10044 / NBRC 100330 / Delta H) TaxID=187420 RepID=O27651_METTH|nr:hypothetical protein [Methanothermobacter thermautotrophicus]AAB86087.1 conserved protein [Methanothermobacter thermautotrophicus str. Delta H]WBF06107.1 hypothetical protein ISG35_07735 [Methanothermobacter thermautotrophicus]WBF07897.1 hypothetical protein ISG36_07790 [Methanothermobacter thermautotrophicus]
MNACVLYSGGKDSSLAAVMLQRLGIQPELVTVNFGIHDSWKPASDAAASLGFPHRVLKLGDEILRDAAETIINDGFPNNGIKHIHRMAVEAAATEYDMVADGTRRDDRTPKLTRDEIQSLEDRLNIEYVNLDGLGHRTVNRLASMLFSLRRERSSIDNSSDYEVEVRLLLEEMGHSSESFFPVHFQTRVTGWNTKMKEDAK